MDEKTQETTVEDLGHLSRKTIITTLTVLGIIALFLATTSLLVQPKTETSVFGLFDPGVSSIQAEPENSIDVLVVGDSIALNSYLPYETWHDYGYTSHVLSTLGQKLPDSDTTLHLALRNQHPKVILFEVQPLLAGTTFDDVLLSVSCRVFPVFRYHSRWRELTSVDFTLQQQEYERSPYHGAKPEYTIEPVSKRTLDAYMRPTLEWASIDAFSAWYFKQILGYCRSVGATPVLYSAPCPKNWNMAKQNAMTAWADEQGVDYYDLNLLVDEIGIDWATDSTDGGEHLNVFGATKLSRYLGKLLDETYKLPDHRNTEGYEQWDEDYELLHEGAVPVLAID